MFDKSIFSTLYTILHFCDLQAITASNWECETPNACVEYIDSIKYDSFTIDTGGRINSPTHRKC